MSEALPCWGNSYCLVHLLDDRKGRVGFVLVALVVEILGHESGPYNPDGVSYDVTDSACSYGGEEVGFLSRKVFFQGLLLCEFVERKEEGMEYWNGSNVSSETWIAETIPL